MYRFYMDAFELEQGALKNAFKTHRIFDGFAFLDVNLLKMKIDKISLI
mgnify:CR=1 FL=1